MTSYITSRVQDETTASDVCHLDQRVAGVSPLPRMAFFPRASAGPDAPSGHLVAVFGHRLAELGGYDDNNPSHCRRPVQAHRDPRPTAGPPGPAGTDRPRLGAEQLAATAVAEQVWDMAKLAFPGQETAWPHALLSRLPAAAGRGHRHHHPVRPEVHRPPNPRRAAPSAAQRLGRDPLPHRDRGLGRQNALGALVRALQRRIPNNLPILAPHRDRGIARILCGTVFPARQPALNQALKEVALRLLRRSRTRPGPQPHARNVRR